MLARSLQRAGSLPAVAVLALAFFPRDVWEMLASMRYIDTPLTYLPALLAAAAVIVMALSSALIAPVVFIGLGRSGTLHRGGLSAVVAATLSVGFFVLLLGHNVERIDLLDDLYRQVGEILG